MNKNIREENEPDVVIHIEDGENSRDLTLVATFQTGAYHRQYCALLSHVPDENGTHPLEIYRCLFTNNPDDPEMANMTISSIESDMVYAEAMEAFKELATELAGRENEEPPGECTNPIASYYLPQNVRMFRMFYGVP